MTTPRHRWYALQKILIAAVCGLAILCVLLFTMLIAIRNAFIAYQIKAEENPPRIIEATDVGYTSVIYGYLGPPIGDEMTITGMIFDRKATNFDVDSVNGEKVTRHVHLVGASKWPEGTRATIRGAGVGMILKHWPGDGATNASDLTNTRQFVLISFVGKQVVEPKGFVLERERW